MSTKRDKAITELWTWIEVVVGNWTIEDQTPEQEALQRQIMHIANDPSVPLSVVVDLGSIIRQAFDVGRKK